MSGEKDLLSTHNSLLTKWAIGGSGTALLSATSLLTSDISSKFNREDDRKRKSLLDPCNITDQKKMKDDQVRNCLVSNKLLQGELLKSGPILTSSRLPMSSLSPSLSKPCLSSNLLTFGSVGISSTTILDHHQKLESPLAQVSLQKNKSVSVSTPSLEIASSLVSKPLHASGMGPEGSNFSTDMTPKPKKVVIDLDNVHSGHGKTMPTVVRDKGQSEIKRSKKNFSKHEEPYISRSFDIVDMPLPEYHLRTNEVDTVEMEIPHFVHPSKDAMLVTSLTRTVQDVSALKNGLINAVSASLLCSPNFKDPNDPSRQQLIAMSENIVNYDPEFILKLAIYSRKELNIRTTSNFLLALSSNRPECRPYLMKYFSTSIALPSDWIEVAEIYQAFKDDNLKFGSLPSSLRRVMIAKFVDFDKYQLAKYNKEKSRLKKNKKKKDENNKEADSGKKSTRGGRGESESRGRGRGRGGVVSLGTKRRRGASESSCDDEVDSEEDSGTVKQVAGVEYDEESETEEERQLKTFTLKQLIRKLHITEPVEHVMCLIGKKYPLTREEFYQHRLPGVWEEERAGKRMKLPIPETWETQVSLKGNKPETWQSLLDNKKLPFMAMLRNLRNLIKAGISSKHHNMVIRRLTDQKQVINSKQFPFRFFSAYEVLTELQNEYTKSQAAIVEAATRDSATGPYRGGGGVGVAARGTGRGGRGKTSGRGGKGKDGTVLWWLKKKQKKEKEKSSLLSMETPYDEALIQRYRKALDTSVKIATVYNVEPIRGRTIIICSQDEKMKNSATAARGIGKSFNTAASSSLLLALMCKYSCEESELILHDDKTCLTAEVDKGTILDNVHRLSQHFPTAEEWPKAKNMSWDEKKRKQLVCGFPYWVVGEKLRDRIQIDNLIVLGFGLEPTQPAGSMIGDFLKQYRHLVNPNLLYVSICATGKGCQFNPSIKAEHENDIYISGFSDAILRFIAERGSGGQLLHVENIDQAYDLTGPTPITQDSVEKQPKMESPEQPLPVSSLVPRWRTARVFISSTFRDMHGERDLLTRFVFPELRALGKHHFINVYEVDLRWGVKEEVSNSNKTLEVCLQELTKCQLFLGLLGERYGWVPASYQVPDTEEFDCVRQYPPGSSVTELEMHFGALRDVQKNKEKGFFFIRDNSFEKDIPLGFKSDFVSESEESKTRMNKLKARVRSSGLEVFDNYPCQWGGVVDNKPMVAGLEEFGQRALNNLWLAVQRLYPDEDALLDEDTHITRLHRAFVDNQHSQFVGRDTLIKNCIKKIVSTHSGIIGLVGKSGSGKSSLMAKVVQEYVVSKYCPSSIGVLVHIVGAAPGSTNLAATLRRLCHEMTRNFCLNLPVPEDFKNLVLMFGRMLLEAGNSNKGSPIVLFMDGLYLMEDAYQPSNLEWLPQPLPPNVVIVLSAVEEDACHQSLVRLKADIMSVGALDMFDKAEVVRKALATHHKALEESAFNNQLRFLMQKKDAHNPLFLKMACEELRVFGVFEKVTSKLKSMSHTTQQLLQEVLQRLETDHGIDLVSTALSFLLCTREGLLAEELHELLAWHTWVKTSKLKVEPFDMVKSRFPSQHFLPPAVFAFLLRSMQSFLNPLQSFSGNICLTLAHPEIRAAIQHRYLRGAASDRELQLHILLAGYFLHQADPNGDGSWKGHNRRAFSELPFHLSAAGCFKDLGSILGSLLFIYAKCMLGLASKLMEDFAAKGSNKKTLEKQRLQFLDSPAFSFLKEYHEFVSNNLHILASHPALMWQQASNSPQNSLVCTQLTQLKTAGLVSVKDYMDWRNRPQYPNPCYLHLTNLDKPVTCVAVSPDNSYFATGSLDCIVHLYDLATGKEIRFYRGHSDAIADVCFVSQTVLCSASLDSTLSLWSVENGHRIALLKGHTRRVNACAAGPTGKVVASASWDCSVKIWNATSGEIICSFSLESPVNDVDFHPDGQLIVTASWDTTIKIFDILHQTRKAVLRGHTSSVRSVTYSNDGCHIASASLDGDVKIWSASKGIQVGNIRGHGAPINKLIFSPTGHELITASDDHKIKIWSGNLGNPLHVLGCEEDGPATAVSLSKDCATVAVGYHSSVVRVFDVTAGLQLFEAKPHTLPVRAIIYSKDSNYILSGSDDTKVFVLESTQGTRVCSMEAHTKPVLGITVHSKFVATTSEDCTCCLYPPIKVAKQTRVAKPLSVLRAHTAPVTSCTFRPDGLKLATSSRDMSVLIWDTTVCQMDPNPTPEIVIDQCHADWVNACCWSNTVDFLVTASSDFNLKVWDLGTKQEKYKLTGHTSSVNAMAYKYGCVVSGSSDGQVKVWNHRGTEITTLYGHSQRVNGCDVFVKCRFADSYNLLAEEDAQKADEEEKEMSWAEETEYNEWAEKNAAILKEAESPKKKKAVLNVQDVVVATCSDDGTVRLWRPLEANTLACLMGHSDRVVGVAADKDGHVVSSGFDHSLRLWTPELVKESYSTAARMGHIAEVTSFSTGTADCNLLLSSDRSGEVKIWQYSSTVECIYTFKAHEKSVNAVCFVNKSCTRFVTASDDMTMALWEILHKKHGVIIRKKKERGLDSPVSSLTWDSTLQSGNSFVLASMWDGQVLYWNIETDCSKTKTVCKVLDYQQGQKMIEAYHHWPLSVNIVNQQLVATATDGHLYILTLKQKQDEIEIAEHKNFLIPTNQVDTTVLADTLSSLHNWVYTSCVSQTGNSLYIGDSLGQLSHCSFSSDNMQQLKVHAGAIRCVVVKDDFVFTSSVDCTIKVWTHKFQQRGQFYCLAPVTSMCLVRTADTSGLHLIAGDSLGNVYHLVWHY